jgi:hypothetical protein
MYQVIGDQDAANNVDDTVRKVFRCLLGSTTLMGSDVENVLVLGPGTYSHSARYVAGLGDSLICWTAE